MDFYTGSGRTRLPKQRELDYDNGYNIVDSMQQDSFSKHGQLWDAMSHQVDTASHWIDHLCKLTAVGRVLDATRRMK